MTLLGLIGKCLHAIIELVHQRSCPCDVLDTVDENLARREVLR